MKKIILWIVITFVIIWIISPIVLGLSGLEFRERSVEQSFEEFRFWGILICILSTLLWTIKRTDKLGLSILKIIGTVGIAILVFCFMAMSVLSGLCDWSNGKILFTSKKNQKIKVIKREYGCGAVDSGQPIVKNFEVKEVAKLFIIAKEINISEIDENEWIKNE